MKVAVTSVLVDDQQKALDFYTGVLGWTLKRDIPAGGARWLTVVSPEGHDDVEVLLEPLGFPEAVEWQRLLKSRGIPLTAFASNDIEAEYARLTAKGVVFTGPPKAMGPARFATFDDTCGNLIRLFQAS